MTQNIYDDPEFEAGYRRLARSVHGLDGALEWPTMQTLLPPIDGARILDLGCGYGWFCRWAAERGARAAVGIDVSEQMLARATSDTDSAVIDYRRQDLETWEVPGDEETYDLVYSSLTLHYIVDVARLFAAVRRALDVDGRFVFSIEHPIFSAPTTQQFRHGDDGTPLWPLDTYLIEGPRTTTWITDGVIKHHRTVATYVNDLIGTGFEIDAMVEFGPTDDQVATDPGLAVELHRPAFLLVAAHPSHD